MKIAVFQHSDGERIALAHPNSNSVLIDVVASDEPNEVKRPELLDVLSLIRTSAEPDSYYIRLKETLARSEDLPSGAWNNIKDLKLKAPLARPGKIICLAGNYREHIIESGLVAPQESAIFTPQLFLKPSTTLVGNGEDIVIGSNNKTVGWETELAVVIGKPGRDIQARNAYDHVFGYTILNDVSERGLNSRIEGRTKREMDGFFDWLAGKWFDGFAPCGPWIVTADEIADPQNLEIRLTVNGQTRQQGNTRDMLFSIPEQIAYISSIMTLEPGDIISTGTPVGAGVGGAASLNDGDEMVCEIAGIGTLRNQVRYDN